MDAEGHALFLLRPARLSRRNLMKPEVKRNSSAAKEHPAQFAMIVGDFAKVHEA
jgi:hypothetical protein